LKLPRLEGETGGNRGNRGPQAGVCIFTAAADKVALLLPAKQLGMS